MSFFCDMCGECCRNIGNSPLFMDFDNGDGVCKFLVGDKCSIYPVRPLFCQIDLCYNALFYDKITKIEYYRMNYEACMCLKRNRRK